jgi:serine/threonine protein kinase/outer membrane biosynthesis protein TonB
VKNTIPFGKYEFLERINAAGMAEVFKARVLGGEAFERLIVVKRPLPLVAGNEDFITTFVDDAKISAQLQHPNIAQVFDHGKLEGSHFITFEYVRGRDLAAIFDRLRRRGEVIPIGLACQLLIELSEALDYIHNHKAEPQGPEQNLVHSGVSPANVLVGFEGEVKLINFGASKMSGRASKTHAGVFRGKAGYLSPEQVGALPLDRRSDLFSAGIVLYELLAGDFLFAGENHLSTLEKVQNAEIPRLPLQNRQVPPELERVVLKALAKRPEDRYQQAAALRDDLRAFLTARGEPTSRKDLGAWMKKTFPAEVEKEKAELEQLRKAAAPLAAAVGAGGAVTAPVMGTSGGAVSSAVPAGLPLPSSAVPRPVVGLASASVPIALPSPTGSASGAGSGPLTLPPPQAAPPRTPTLRPTGAGSTKLGLGAPDPKPDPKTDPKATTESKRETKSASNMSSDDAAIDLWNDTDDITAVKAPPQTLIQESKEFTLSDPLPSMGSGPSPAGKLPAGAPAAQRSSTSGPLPASGRHTITGGSAAPSTMRSDPSSPWSVPPRSTPAGGVVPPGLRSPGSGPPTRSTPSGGLPPTGSARAPLDRATPAAPRTVELPATGTGSAPERPTPSETRVVQVAWPDGLKVRHETPAPFASSVDVPSGAPRKPSRAGLYVGAAVLLVAAGAVAAWRHFSAAHPGTLQISTVPADATIMIGDSKIADHSPVTLDRPPGVYTISVTRDGYVRSEQSIEVKEGQVVVLPITLAQSTETGIEVTSDPPGMPVWLDGAPLGAGDTAARAEGHTYSVQPGKHVLEIRGDSKYKPWREEVEIEPGTIRNFSVQLARVDSAEPSRRATTGVVTSVRRANAAPSRSQASASSASSAPVAAAEPPAPPPAPAEKPAAAPTPAAVVASSSPGEHRRARESSKEKEEPSRSEKSEPAEKHEPAASAPSASAAAAAPSKPAASAPVAAPAPAAAAVAPAPAKLAAAAPAAAAGPAPRMVPGRVANNQLAIDPNGDEYRVRLPPSLARAGMQFSAVVRLCVSAQGSVTEVRILKSADPTIDSQIPAVLGRWRYRPLIADGKPTPFCYVLKYDIASR